jgi:hypothetical protein
LGRIQAEAKLQLPRGTQLLEFSQREPMFDSVWAAKLAVPEASRHSFAAQLSDKPLDHTERSGTYATSVPWWHPADASLARQYLADTNTLVNVVLVRESGRTIAYVECAVF